MKHDSKGRNVKEDNDGYNLNLYIPPIKIMIYWIFFFEIIFPWIVIGAKFELLKKIFIFFENLMQSPTDDIGETPKNLDYFIN